MYAERPGLTILPLSSRPNVAADVEQRAVKVREEAIQCLVRGPALGDAAQIEAGPHGELDALCLRVQLDSAPHTTYPRCLLCRGWPLVGLSVILRNLIKRLEMGAVSTYFYIWTGN